MKRSILIILLSLAFGLHEEMFAQNLKIAKESDLALVLKQSEKDTIMLKERMAALEFHKILNDYRKSNGLDTVKWNESLWLTCRNHNFYMNANDILTHSEVKDKQYFTGVNPGDRLSYVQEKEKTLSWNGENALYNYSNYGSSNVKIAKHIALSSFEQWKNSPGHNANMLSNSPTIHGVAFIIGGGKVYGTSLFGYIGSDYWKNYYKITYNEPSDDKTSGVAPTTKTLSTQPKTEPKTTRLNLGKAHLELEKLFIKEITKGIEKQSVIQDKVFLLAAKKQIEYMAVNSLVESEQKWSNKSFYAKDLAKRLAKAEGNHFWFLKSKTNISEYISFIEIEESGYIEEIICKQLINKLITENGIDLNVAKKIGFSVKVKRSKSSLKIYAVLIIE